MKLYYRISDNSYEKEKVAGATKERCLENFVRAFKYADADLTVIADKCQKPLLDFLRSRNGFKLIETDLGNAGSLRFAIKKAIELDDSEVVYFSEDDYFHNYDETETSLCASLIQQIQKRSEYFTLYDHPDKYMDSYNGGEYSKVIRTASSHWRYTISTCMTFGTTVAHLKADWEIWEKYTEGHHPVDHFIFKDLRELKKRRLAVCIPGQACHMDLGLSARPKGFRVEEWALQKARGPIPEIPYLNFLEKTKDFHYIRQPEECSHVTSSVADYTKREEKHEN